MQRHLARRLPVIALLLLLPACQDGPLLQDESPPTAPSIGAVHNEFLELLYERLEARPAGGEEASRWAAVVEASHGIADRYRVARLDERQILEAVQLGRLLSKRDPAALAEELLSADELEWWERYSNEATYGTARVVYQSHALRFGAPPAGSRLADFLDVAVHSAEFWSERHGEDDLHYFDPATGEIHKGWRHRGRRLLRFGVAVAVDGFAGTAATGGVGPVGGAIVGGLASYGADCLLFGCG